MKMDEQRLEYLSHKWLTGELTTEEQLEFDLWFKELNDVPLHVPDSVASNESEHELLLFQQIQQRINKEQNLTKRKSIRLYSRIAAAASIIFMIGAATLYFTNRMITSNAGEVTLHDVAPGKVGATLTLANGQKINLGDAANGKLAEQSGVVVNKTADGELVYVIKGNTDETSINTIATSNGETYRLRLPDGSLVWLNSASSLRYNAALNTNGQRRVELTGEGYFEVAKDRTRPFVVKTRNQDVEVLGTQFNINSYPDEPAIKTTLIEGSVKVSTRNKVRIISPGEEAVSAKTDIAVRKVNVENATDWKDGDFSLDDVPFKVAMRKISRWYDVEMVYDNSITEDMQSFGMISRNQPLSAILRGIERSGQVYFKIQDRKVYVSKRKI